ncbi:MAG: class I SAM-dependent methyltransferase [candidate division WOR-3 bacterium]|nr:class I SAM-dependent methyltransferase [candidate division WOR-3 bacterium]MCX7757864.1 class I SAM-dependent methyltransferase [candidate division WOR-3 bacterium]MDW7988355.1 class I SAM-dependent methyltransferase [candidate division WOR-3 bacterium]
MAFYDFKSKVPRTPLGQKIVEKVTDNIFLAVKPYLKDGFQILDVGAGNGEFAKRCLGNDFNYTAIEINDQYCQKLLLLGAKVIKTLVPPIPCSDNQFDYVHLSHILEHTTSHEKALELVLETRRVLKPKGYICIIAPDYLHSPTFFYDSDYTHSFITTENRVKLLLMDAGFKIVFSKYLNAWEIGGKGIILSTIGWFYNNLFYWLFYPFAKLFIESTRFSRTRGALHRSIFILAQKV